MLHLRPYSLIAVLLGAACVDEPTKLPRLQRRSGLRQRGTVGR